MHNDSEKKIECVSFVLTTSTVTTGVWLGDEWTHPHYKCHRPDQWRLDPLCQLCPLPGGTEPGVCPGGHPGLLQGYQGKCPV